ncbi:Glycosyl hydrolases family 43 [Novipirellula aureliae]|uniref:Glycosyl hydrolases family 43 n=2 Tax=Novipirellula aureliae TaxID=2527966 RepID=A0A5C6DRN4_9BACT|nr:Glycosyl hydrolases family 43 [Novipirellula aureliae]
MVDENETLRLSLKWSRDLCIAHAAPEGGLLTGMSYSLIAILALVVIGLPVTATAEESKSTKETPAQKDWTNFVPVDPTPAKDGVVDLKATTAFLSEPDIMRRDPSDVIRCGDTYYVWYTKVLKGQPGYPGGWSGSVWYATSHDGHQWEEQGPALHAGGQEEWDGAGVYTPNILPYQGKYYLAYTAMAAPFDRKLSRASIGIAVSDSPDGPWKKLQSNPVIKPSDSTNDPDSFLCDDAVFVVHDGKIWLYYKGFAGQDLEDGTRIRVRKTTFLLTATADTPEGPYTKVPKILHRGHEALVWKDSNFIGSMCVGIGWGPSRMFSSADGVHFQSIYKLNPQLAAGIYRHDFEEDSTGARPSWGVSMEENKGQGLSRFEIIWPQDNAK